MKDVGIVGAQIRMRRKRLGWTVQKLATMAGLTASFVSRMERGKTYYSYETLVKLAGALGVHYEQLHISGSNAEPAPATGGGFLCWSMRISPVWTRRILTLRRWARMMRS